MSVVRAIQNLGAELSSVKLVILHSLSCGLFFSACGRSQLGSDGVYRQKACSAGSLEPWKTASGSAGRGQGRWAVLVQMFPVELAVAPAATLLHGGGRAKVQAHQHGTSTARRFPSDHQGLHELRLQDLGFLRAGLQTENREREDPRAIHS